VHDGFHRDGIRTPSNSTQRYSDHVGLLLLLLFPFSSSIPVPAGFGYRPPMPQKSPEKVSELYTLHLTTSISYVMTYVFHYHADADFLKDCGGGEWLGDDPTG